MKASVKEEENRQYQASTALMDLAELKVRPKRVSNKGKTSTQLQHNNKLSSAVDKPQIPISREMLVRLIDWIKEV